MKRTRIPPTPPVHEGFTPPPILEIVEFNATESRTPRSLAEPFVQSSNRDRLLATLAAHGWGLARIVSEIRTGLPAKLVDAPIVVNTLEQMLYDLDRSPIFFEQFSDDRFVNGFIKPTIDGEIWRIQSQIASIVYRMRRKYPLLRSNIDDIITDATSFLCEHETETFPKYDPGQLASFDGWIQKLTRRIAMQWVHKQLPEVENGSS